MTFNPLGNLKIPVNVVPTRLPDPTPIRGNTYRAWRGSVFTRMPSASDVKQGDLANCYLLASLQAILARRDGPSVIQELVKDEGDSVVMKMYKDEDKRWHYVRLNKALPGRFFSDRDHSVGAKWVQLFEKAFAAFSANGSYEAMGGCGQIQAATKMFLGEGRTINRPTEDSFETLRKLIDMTSFDLNLDKGSAKLREDLDRSIGLSVSEAGEWYRWKDKCGVKKESFKKCLQPPYTCRLDQIVKDFSDGPHVLSLPVKTKILEWHEREKPVPGAVGSGSYTPGQEDFFMRIQRAIGAQRSVGVETMDSSLWPVAPTRRGGAHESKLDGLASNHAYSIVDTKIQAGIKYLLIRNPWGTYQRLYVPGPSNTLVAKAGTRSGDSWVELTDFFRHFHATFVEGAPVHTAARAGLMTDLEGQLQRGRANLMPLTRPRGRTVL